MTDRQYQLIALRERLSLASCFIDINTICYKQIQHRINIIHHLIYKSI